MAFDFDSYIVLDVPSPPADRIMAIREANRDVFRASLPVEITIAGSSGVGALDPAQSAREVFGILDEIATTTSPFSAQFSNVIRFPGTDIFVLTLADESPFRELHKHIIQSLIKFKPSQFPYKPHCTLRSRSPVTAEEEDELLNVAVPGIFTLDTISVYMMKRLAMDLLYRTYLSGPSDAA